MKISFQYHQLARQILHKKLSDQEQLKLSDLQLLALLILNEIKIEEIRFRETLERGEKLLDELISSGQKLISGFKAFELYDTYGFPLELTVEIAEENSISVDLKGFEAEMNAQKERAKAASSNIDLTLEG